MIVVTNMFGVESADLFLEASGLGLKLEGIIAPFITLDVISDLVTNFQFSKMRMITIIPTIHMWQSQIEKLVLSNNKLISFPLDWVKSLEKYDNPHVKSGFLIPDWNKYVYSLKGVIEGKDFEIEIHPKGKGMLHTKLYLYDKGFVISSANLTPEGHLLRQMELGILIREEDNKTEVQVVKQLFEHYWIGEEYSCSAIRDRIKVAKIESEF